METKQQFQQAMGGKLKGALEQGDIYKFNEINANIMLGSMLFVTIMLSVGCLVLNEVGVFTVSKNLMRMVVLDIIIIETPIMMINKKMHAEPSWMKGLIIWGQILAFAFLGATLGHNATLGMVVPILLSIRYCDGAFTKKVAVRTVLSFLVATILNGYIGVINLNMLPIAPGTTITVETTLRAAINAMGIDHKQYLISSLRNDFLPKYIIFALISFTATLIASRGMEMCKTQDNISKNTSRIETELNLATQIQAGMLPCIFPAFPDHGELQLYATNIPAKEVGGDFYDYFKIDDDHVALVMADVSGKGVGAALFMTISKIVLKNQLLICKNPSEAMTNTNNQLCENNIAGLFVTTWAGVYEISSGTLTYVCAGHNPPVIRHKGQDCEYLVGKNGLVLAAMDGIKYSQNSIHLDKGDEIFLYTDGVTEATDTNNELYGEPRLLECLNKLTGLSCEEQIKAVNDDITEFIKGAEQFDDITMMAMKIIE